MTNFTATGSLNIYGDRYELDEELVRGLIYFSRQLYTLCLKKRSHLYTLCNFVKY